MRDLNIYVTEKLRINKDTEIKSLSEDIKKLISLISNHIDDEEAIEALSDFFKDSGISGFQAYLTHTDYKKFKELSGIDYENEFSKSKIHEVSKELVENLKHAIIGDLNGFNRAKHQIYPKDYSSLYSFKLYLYKGDNNIGCWISTKDYNMVLIKNMK